MQTERDPLFFFARRRVGGSSSVPVSAGRESEYDKAVRRQRGAFNITVKNVKEVFICNN